MTKTNTTQNPLFNAIVLNQEQIDHYHNEGYLLIDQTLKPEGVAAMLTECMDAWRKEKGEFDPSNSWLQNALLVDIHHHSKLVADFYFRGPLVHVASQLIGPNIKGATSQLTFKMRGNTKPFGWHQDNGYGELEPYNAMTALTALEDNDNETGCLWILPKSHQHGQMKSQKDLTPEEKAAKKDLSISDVDESGAIPLPMKAGQTLVFNCWTLHKSEGNFSKKRDRRVLFLRYADADAVEVYNDRKPRLGRLVKGETLYPEVAAFEKDL